MASASFQRDSLNRKTPKTVHPISLPCYPRPREGDSRNIISTIPICPHLKTGLQGMECLLSDEGVGLVDECAPLRVAQDDPRNPKINELLRADFSGVCAGGGGPAVLGRNLQDNTGKHADVFGFSVVF